MKHLALLATLTLLVPAIAHAELAVGSAAPAFTLEAVDGSKVSLADQSGKIVVLEWINPNCPFSLRHTKEKTMIGLAAANPEVVWLAINSTNPSHKDYLDPAAHAAFNTTNGITYPVLYDRDGAVAKAYDAKTTPHMFIIAADGTVAYNGAIDDNPRAASDNNYVEAALAAIAADKPADPSVTKPYGCSIKF